VGAERDRPTLVHKRPQRFSVSRFHLDVCPFHMRSFTSFDSGFSSEISLFQGALTLFATHSLFPFSSPFLSSVVSGAPLTGFFPISLSRWRDCNDQRPFFFAQELPCGVRTRARNFRLGPLLLYFFNLDPLKDLLFSLNPPPPSWLIFLFSTSPLPQRTQLPLQQLNQLCPPAFPLRFALAFAIPSRLPRTLLLTVLSDATLIISTAPIGFFKTSPSPVCVLAPHFAAPVSEPIELRHSAKPFLFEFFLQQEPHHPTAKLLAARCDPD